MMKFALAAATLVAVLCVHADAQTCPPGYKSAAGACVHTCPGVMRIQAVPVSIVDREEAEALDQPSASAADPEATAGVMCERITSGCSATSSFANRCIDPRSAGDRLTNSE
jgi:hypothetical protein